MKVSEFSDAVVGDMLLWESGKEWSVEIIIGMHHQSNMVSVYNCEDKEVELVYFDDYTLQTWSLIRAPK